jgi:hypothetical protein
MSSIIEGYEYDIFISSRQKDNKRDGWVTEFFAATFNKNAEETELDSDYEMIMIICTHSMD